VANRQDKKKKSETKKMTKKSKTYKKMLEKKKYAEKIDQRAHYKKYGLTDPENTEWDEKRGKVIYKYGGIYNPKPKPEPKQKTAAEKYQEEQKGIARTKKAQEWYRKEQRKPKNVIRRLKKKFSRKY